MTEPDVERDPLSAPAIRRIFISYAREDVVWAEETARRARALGVEAFFDVDSIRAGKAWPRVLLEQIEGADLLWLGWSKYAAQSEWVGREYGAALERGAEIRIDRLDDTALPDALKHIQAEYSSLAQPRVERLLRDPARPLPEEPELPSVLLRPEYGVVPFTGREEILEDIRAWCHSEAPFAARLIVGPGGSGKTRLLIESCRRMGEEGWEAGFLDGEALEEAVRAEPDVVDGLFRPRLPRLMVMDYAEARRSQLQALLDRAPDTGSGQPVRLVLLARSAADWWAGLLARNFAMQELLGGPGPAISLAPLAAGDQARSELFQAAVAAFATALERDRPPGSPPDLSGDHFARVLFLHSAALAWVLGERLGGPLETLDFLLAHEERYWIRAAEGLGLASYLHASLQGAAALLVLVGGCGSRDDLPGLLARSPDLSELARAERRQVAGLFAGLYEADGRIEALQPDLLGENLVARAFRDDRELRSSWTVGAGPGELRGGLTVLNRTVAHHPEASSWLRELLCARLAPLAEAAIEVAVESGDPIGQILAGCFRERPDPALAGQLEGNLPEQTVALRELAVELSLQALQEAGLADDTSDAAVQRARLLSNLGVRLGELGRREGALQATQEAVEIRRGLAETRPDAFLPDLAASLNNLGTRLSELGRREEALQAAQEAVDTYRKLAETRPDAFLPELAASLNNLGTRLSELGRREEALQAAQEAVAAYRKLAETRPDAFLPDLAASLNNLGTRLSELGRREEALQAAQEAVDTYRKLAETRPDAFLPDLAMSLNNLGTRLSELGRREEALQAAQEAVAAYRKLAETRPDAFRPDLAMSLNNLGTMLSELGRREEALQAAQEAVDTLLPAFQVYPAGYADWMATMVRNYVRYADEAGTEPDESLLQAVAALFEDLDDGSEQ